MSIFPGKNDVNLIFHGLTRTTFHLKFESDVLSEKHPASLKLGRQSKLHGGC